MNTGDLWPDLDQAELQVLRMQAKLHQWATDSPERRFCDLYNLVADPAFLVVAWHRVRGNRGARSPGVDGVKPSSVLFGTGFSPSYEETSKRGGSSLSPCGNG